MKKILNTLLAALCLIFNIQSEPAPSNEHKVEWVIDQLYGEHGIQTSPPRLHAIQELLKNVINASPYQLQEIAAQTLIILKNELLMLNTAIATLEKEQRPIPPTLFFNRFILEEQIASLSSYKQSIEASLNTVAKVEGFLKNIYDTSTTWLEKKINSKAAKDSFIMTVAEQLAQYCAFERTALADYRTLTIFLNNQAQASLPPIMHFWHANEIRNKLRMRAQLLTPEVRVQFWAEIGMLAFQSILMGGSSMYNEIISEQDQAKFKELAGKQQKVQEGFTTFINKTRTDQSALRQTITKAFAASYQDISKAFQATGEQKNNEVIYLFKSINLNDPVEHDLEYPPTWSDQLFEVSRVNTPKGHRWHNVFQCDGSDWEYDPEHNSFWQNGLSTFDPKQISAFGDIVSPESDHIFTEYSAHKAEYEINVECRLINCTYPFFAGIMFNKGRWISGAPERFYQCRLLGFYGTADQHSHAINICFAQQKIGQKDKDGKKVPDINTPLQQITTNNQTYLASLSKEDVALLIKDPITFIINIVTKPDQVTITISKKGTNATLLQKTITNLDDPFLAIFGGIGFMAAGCQAEFKLIKPEAVVFAP